MAVQDLLPTIVILALVFFVFRWLTKPGDGTGAGDSPIRGVSRQMVETVHAAFPDIPPPNIIYHLSRTRSTQATSEEILERGYLAAPPASFVVPPSLLPPPPEPPTQDTDPKPASPAKAQQTLIDRYGLTSRLPSAKGKEKEGELPAGSVSGSSGSSGHWSDTKEKREQDLKARKERMILEARQRMLAKQAKAAEVS